mmetsp:Transcript_4173/g.8649  ORF Transcript_4173/g.8649 Transcript_4173/m.8649 type:complete len:222 (-) Transcript_4173:2254-2919(-)
MTSRIVPMDLRRSSRVSPRTSKFRLKMESLTIGMTPRNSIRLLVAKTREYTPSSIAALISPCSFIVARREATALSKFGFERTMRIVNAGSDPILRRKVIDSRRSRPVPATIISTSDASFRTFIRYRRRDTPISTKAFASHNSTASSTTSVRCGSVTDLPYHHELTDARARSSGAKALISLMVFSIVCFTKFQAVLFLSHERKLRQSDKNLYAVVLPYNTHR